MSSRFPTSRDLNVDQLIEYYDGIVPDVEEVLRDSCISDSLPVPEAPDGMSNVIRYAKNNDPLLPTDLTALDSLSLGKLYSFFANWANYVQTEHTNAKGTRLILQRDVKVVKAALTAYYKDETDTPANRVDEKLELDPRFSSITKACLTAEITEKKMESRLSTLTRSCGLISREQTRRGEEYGRTEHDERGGRPRWDKRQPWR